MKKWHGIGITWLLLAIMACGPGGKGTGVLQLDFPEMQPPPAGPVVSEPYRIMKGDTLNVTFPLNPELDLKPVLVRPDGKIVMNLVGEVNAFGMTVPELRQAISREYREYIAKTKYGEVLKPNDYFDLKFIYNPELNIGVRIQPDGKVSLPIVGEVQAANLTPGQLRLKLIKLYSRDIRQPDIAVLTGTNTTAFPMDIAAKNIYTQGDFITVAVVKSGGQWVYVAGQVYAPKAIPWEGSLTVLQAIAAAGGKTDKADLARVVIVRRGPFESAQWMQTDLASPLEGRDLKNDLALRSGDVVVVPMSGVAKLGVFVQQVLRDLNPMYGTYTISLGSVSGAYTAPIP
jgi:protein involved in polysaccharide export with SLBB domain